VPFQQINAELTQLLA